MWQQFIDFFRSTGFTGVTWQHCVMYIISFVLIYLAVKKEYEPLLLIPIGFGMLLANLPFANLMEEI